MAAAVLVFLLVCILGTGDVMAVQYDIVIPEKPGRVVFPPGESYRYPAEFLQNFLQRLTGRRLPVISEKEARPDRGHIYLGETAFACRRIPDMSRLHPEELVLLPAGRDLIICGEVSGQGKDRVDRGTLFGVYEYLERQYGVRWFFPASSRWPELGSGEIVRTGQTLGFPEKEIRSRPCFGRRSGGISYYYQPLAEQKKWHPVLRFGDTLSHANANHTQINWVRLYGKEHPEYFARDSRNQVRINRRYPHRTYICLSSDKVLKQMMDNLRKFDSDGIDPGCWGPCRPSADCVYFAANDGMIPRTTCHCPRCAELLQPQRRYEEQGSELFFGFVARYAGEVAKARSGRRLATLAYSHYLAPPEKTVLPGNVDVSYVGPRIQYANNPDLYRLHLGYVKRWSGLLGESRSRLNCWLNIVNPAQYVSAVPFAYPGIFQKWLQETEKMFSGFFINGLNPYQKRFGQKGVLDAVQTLPMVYWQGRLLWNPDSNPDRLLEDYCDYLYGSAAEEMKRFHRKIRERWENFYQTEDDTDELAFIHTVRYPAEQVAFLKNCLEQAAEKAEEPRVKKMIRFLQKEVYGRFFQESERYHRKCGSMAFYACAWQSKPPAPGQWRNIPALQLSRFRWGESPDHPTSVKMVHDGSRVFFRAELEKPGPQEDFRIQIAVRPDALHKQYSPNIPRDWKAFRELRIRPDGSTVKYGSFPGYSVKSARQGNTWIIEGSWKLDQKMNPWIFQGLRVQFLRYGGVWNDYDIWNPTLAGTTDYPTWKFGLVQLLPPPAQQRDGLE